MMYQLLTRKLLDQFHDFDALETKLAVPGNAPRLQLQLHFRSSGGDAVIHLNIKNSVVYP